VTNDVPQPFRRRLRAWRHRIRNRRSIDTAMNSGREIVLLHQMGKVGSSSVRDTLRSMDGVHVFQTHWCNERNLAHRAGIVHEDRRISNRYGDRDHFGAMLHHRIIEPRGASKVITMVRDPIARNVSSYFQHLDEIWGVRRAHERIELDELLRGFHEVFEHDEPLTWFDTEVRDLFGVDVFAIPFDRERRWSLLESDSWSVLVMRADLPDDGKQQAMSSLLGCEIPVLSRSNVGEDKGYASVYTAFKKRLELPAAYLDRFYDAPVTRHFFTDEEIDRLRRRWTADDGN